MRNALVVMLLLTGPLCWSALLAWQAPAVDQDFRSFLQEWEKAQTRFINGDPTLWKQHTSQRADVTILGGFGGEGEKGWNAVGARYDWASAQYQAGRATMTVEYLSVVVNGDVAFTAGVERQHNVRVGSQPETAARALRATQVFRKENGQWKLLHRHADQMTEKPVTAGVPERR